MARLEVTFELVHDEQQTAPRPQKFGPKTRASVPVWHTEKSRA